MLHISVEQRRVRLVRRHRLSTDTAAASVDQAAESVLALHATDPATVYLSALVRCPDAGLADVAAALYEHRSVVRMMGMRRTMFVVPAHLAPVVHSAASLAIAKRLRTRLVKELRTGPTDPEMDRDVDEWLADVEDSTEEALLARGEASANELATDEPRLRTALLPTTDKAWDTKSNITTRVLTLMGAEGRIVRAEPSGSWFSRRHRWAPARQWWPDGIPAVPETDARVALVRRWLEVFGPATEADVQWWTGWSAGVTRQALASIDTVPVDLHGTEGLVLADDTEADDVAEPSAALLPALDPTPMGWKEREWFLGPHREPLFDRFGNIGPTVWWGGRVVGGWAVHDGQIVWRLLEAVGSDVESAVAETAADLTARLEGIPVVPTFRTPLERELSR